MFPPESRGEYKNIHKILLNSCVSGKTPKGAILQNCVLTYMKWSLITEDVAKKYAKLITSDENYQKSITTVVLSEGIAHNWLIRETVGLALPCKASPL